MNNNIHSTLFEAEIKRSGVSNNTVSQEEEEDETPISPLEILKEKERAERTKLRLEIDQLKQEIIQLEDRLHSSFAPLPQPAHLQEQYLRDSLNNQRSRSSLVTLLPHDNAHDSNTYRNTHIGSSHELRSLAGITGVRFHDSTNYILSCDYTDRGEIKTIRRYVLSATTYGGLSFALQFDVHEELMSVIHLHTTVDPRVKVETAVFIARVEKERSIRGFFNGFVQYLETLSVTTYVHRYAKVYSQRKQLFMDMSRQFPQYVSIPHVGSNLLAIRGRPGCGFELRFIWEISYKALDLVQSLELVPFVSTDYKQNLAHALPQQFKYLVELKGLQRALEIMINIVTQ